MPNGSSQPCHSYATSSHDLGSLGGHRLPCSLCASTDPPRAQFLSRVLDVGTAMKSGPPSPPIGYTSMCFCHHFFNSICKCMVQIPKYIVQILIGRKISNTKLFLGYVKGKNATEYQLGNELENWHYFCGSYYCHRTILVWHLSNIGPHKTIISTSHVYWICNGTLATKNIYSTPYFHPLWPFALDLTPLWYIIYDLEKSSNFVNLVISRINLICAIAFL